MCLTFFIESHVMRLSWEDQYIKMVNMQRVANEIMGPNAKLKVSCDDSECFHVIIFLGYFRLINVTLDSK